MAIKLKVQESPIVKFQVGSADGLSFKVTQGIPIYPSSYQGAYTVTPTQSTQVLQTDHLMLNGNVVVNPIPSNYGLITYSGNIITVS